MSELGKKDWLGRTQIGFIDGHKIYETKQHNILEIIRRYDGQSVTLWIADEPINTLDDRQNLAEP